MLRGGPLCHHQRASRILAQHQGSGQKIPRGRHGTCGSLEADSGLFCGVRPAFDFRGHQRAPHGRLDGGVDRQQGRLQGGQLPAAGFRRDGARGRHGPQRRALPDDSGLRGVLLYQRHGGGFAADLQRRGGQESDCIGACVFAVQLLLKGYAEDLRKRR